MAWYWIVLLIVYWMVAGAYQVRRFFDKDELDDIDGYFMASLWMLVSFVTFPFTLLIDIYKKFLYKDKVSVRDWLKRNKGNEKMVN